jgi:hypothetical protein
MRQSIIVAVLCAHVATTSIAFADCVYPVDRYVELRVDSCASAIERVKSAIVGKGYTEQEMGYVQLFANNMVVVHAQQLADIEIIFWYSEGNLRRYKGNRKEIKAAPARDYLVAAPAGCGQLNIGKPQMYNIYGNKACHDNIVLVDGKEPNETNPGLILNLLELSYLWDQESLENIESRFRMDTR